MNTQSLKNDKAPLLLYELEGRIGLDALKQVMWNLLLNKVSTTYEFKRILTDLEGEETAEWFIRKLQEQ